MQGLVTNDVMGPLPCWSALLTPQGKALFDFIIWDDGDALLIDCERVGAEDLAKRLKMYRLRRPIDIEIVFDLAVHWAARDGLGGPDPRAPALGHRWIAAPDAPTDGWLAHRLAHGLAEGRAELGDGTTLWLECNAREFNAVSFTKGCYVGQENTARMHHRGKVTRQLAVVPISEAGPAPRMTYPALGLAVVHRRILSDEPQEQSA